MNYMTQYVIYSNNTVRLIHMNLQVENSRRCACAFCQHQAWVKLQLALFLPLLTVLQLYYLPPLLLLQSVTCLFTQCQPMYASCCTVLLYFSRYYTVRFKIFSLLLCLFFILLVYFYILLYIVLYITLYIIITYYIYNTEEYYTSIKVQYYMSIVLGG